MKITISWDFTEQELRAIASEATNFKRLKAAPATKAMVLEWLKQNIQKSVECTEETYLQGGEK